MTATDLASNGPPCSWQGILTSALSHARYDVSYDTLKYWFNELKNYLAQVKHADILEDLSRLYNCDETGFPLAPKTKKAIASKHDKHVYQGATPQTRHR